MPPVNHRPALSILALSIALSACGGSSSSNKVGPDARASVNLPSAAPMAAPVPAAPAAPPAAVISDTAPPAPVVPDTMPVAGPPEAAPALPGAVPVADGSPVGDPVVTKPVMVPTPGVLIPVPSTPPVAAVPVVTPPAVVPPAITPPVIAPPVVKPPVVTPPVVTPPVVKPPVVVTPPVVTPPVVTPPVATPPVVPPPVVVPVAVPAAWTTGVTSFVHPGIGYNAADLAQYKAHVLAGEEPWASGYHHLGGRTPLNYAMLGPFAIANRNIDLNRGAFERDMQMAYNHALMWYVSGNSAHAEKSISILDAWATTNTSLDGVEAALMLGDYSGRAIIAADILRGLYPGWTATHTAHMKSWLENVWWRRLQVGGSSAIGTALGNGSLLKPCNQGGLALKAALAVAVFLDSPLKFDQVINAYLSDPGGLDQIMSNGEVGDTGRDQGHAHGQIATYGAIAETAWKQGIDLYSLRNNRLLAAGEYYANYNLGKPFTFNPVSCGYGYYTQIGAQPLQTMPANLFETLYTHYVVRKGLKAPNVAQYRELAKSRGEAGPYSGPYSGQVYRRTKDSSTARAVTFPFTAPVMTAATSFTQADLGKVQTPGSATNTGANWKMTASGAGAEKGYHFAYKELKGDVEVIATVTDPGALSTGVAGIMIRSSLDARPATAAAQIYVAPASSGNGTHLFWRVGTQHYGGYHAARRFTSAVAPMSLKLVRHGNFVYAYLSSNGGTDWSAIGTIIYPELSDTLYVGIFTASGDPAATTTASFENVKIGSKPGSLVAPPTKVSANARSGGVAVQWAASPMARSYDVLRATNASGPFERVGTELTGTSFVDAGATGSAAYFYVVKASTYSGLSGPSAVATLPAR
ncbi:alginate lyase family protein [Massilia pseudoviolaceinigra]|uniref:alginate lyase family protein n=1 Tax=Massilia pseudoviolaceinigra TaxID=3057165 RepID=UPI0027967C01|nr:alginate lyase family protein [Massilia sp. CCM 9206]MDQ1922086.1 alginate lyase family protein [Massilia sp. CCM 9206]